MAFKLEDVVAPPSYAPQEWQISAPRESYGHRTPVAMSHDLQRVLALPRRPLELDGTERAEAIIDMVSERYSRNIPEGACACSRIDPERHRNEGCITRLRIVQALALREIGIVGGLLGPIGTGHGKTLIDLLAPLAFAHHSRATGLPDDDLLCVLFVPPGLVVQLAGDYDYIGQHFKMPSMIVQGAPDMDRIMPGMPRLQVMPYSRISRKEATAWLRQVQPHAIIADECHKLRDRKTATTKRVMRFFDEHPHTRFAAWSGSVTSKSIQDYAHLSALALKNGSPLPIDPENVSDWARAIDPPMRAGGECDPGPLLEGLIATGCCTAGQPLYRGFATRLHETLGVVSTRAPAVDIPLEITERKPPKAPDGITEHIKNAMAFVRPDGEELVTAMQAVECAIQIASGFHYKWIFPKHKFPDDEQLITDWRMLRAAWHKEQRTKLKASEENLDSPALLEHAAQRALGLRVAHKGMPVWHSLHYKAWHAIKDRVHHEGQAVRLDDWLVQDAARWMHSNHGIVWYAYKEFAEWLSEVSGLPYFGEGKESKAGLLRERGDRSVIASIKAHGTGTNKLQFAFSSQLYGQPPGSPDGWEQSLSRLHRPGQTAPEVTAEFYMHTRELRKRVLGALRKAYYVAGTMRSDQRIHMGFHSEIEETLETEFDEGDE